eukprot:jgi/Ulvmu1/6597/UM003_0234.1
MVEPSIESQREQAKRLDARKKIMEVRLGEILSELDSMPGSPGLYDSLVDSEGYPRSDVDIMRTRQLRQEHIMLHNDLRSAMDELHKVLNSIHGSMRNAATSPPDAQAQSAFKSDAVASAPFAVVQAVAPKSPADEGGLQVGDKVIKFGDAQGPSGLTTLQTRLQVYKDKPQEVVVQRRGEVMQLHVTPQTWSGSGLLGGTLVPM